MAFLDGGEEMKTTAIVLAAGQGKRMGAGKNKQFLLLGGMTILERTLRVFEAYAGVTDVILVVHKEEAAYVRKQYGAEFAKVKRIVVGGKERQDSVYAGLQALDAECGYVMIHDGARPLVDAAVLERVERQMREYGSAVAAVRVKDTIKEADADGVVVRTIPRERLWSMQTPQAFEKERIVRAYELAMRDGYYGTDDASLMEYAGQEVRLAEGSYENVKMTTAEDLAVGEMILKRRGEL